LLLMDSEAIVSGDKIDPAYRNAKGPHALDLRQMRWRKIS